MSQVDVLVKALSKLDEDAKRMELDTVLGHAKDFGAYQYMCGVYRGLLVAKNILVDLIETLEKEDE